MNCEQARGHMLDSLYGEASTEETEGLERHLSSCPECRGEAGRLRAARAAVAGFLAAGGAGRRSPDRSSADRPPATEGPASPDPAVRRLRIGRAVLVAASLAAAVVAALLLGRRGGPPPSDTDPNDRRVRADNPGAPPPGKADATGESVLPKTARTSPTGLALPDEWQYTATSDAGRDQPPERHAVQANADFAVDLYRRLAKGNPGRNVLFSPYSVSSALAMLAEGARGETADEIGRVLRFPEAARRTGADARQQPWNTAVIHRGMKVVSDRINGKDREPAAAIRDRMARNRAERDRINGRALDPDEAGRLGKRLERLNEELRRDAERLDPYELAVADALWGDKATPFRPEFAAAMERYYFTGAVRNVDFRGNPEAARSEINDWCKARTRGRIPEALGPGMVDSDTRMVLADAIYFKGEWAEPFDAGNTRDEDFRSPAGNRRARMMHGDGLREAGYAAFNADGTPFATPDRVPHDEKAWPKVYPERGGFLLAELPYKGRDLAMVVLVPTAPDGLDAVEDRLSPERLKAWTDALRKRSLNVHLPKFRMETDHTLNDTLQEMGMRRAFHPGAADFNGLGSAERLFVSFVKHKAFVAVDEKGTEAAAVTAAGFGFLSVPVTVPFVPTVRADRPFLFLIRDVKTGTILFLGRVAEPEVQSVGSESPK